MIKVLIFVIAGIFMIYGICEMSRAMKQSIEKNRLCELRDEKSITRHGSRSEYFLLVQNCDYNIEWLIRSFYHSHPDDSVTNPGLTVVDINSNDETRKILNVLQTKYEDLHIMSMQEFELYLRYDGEISGS